MISKSDEAFLERVYYLRETYQIGLLEAKKIAIGEGLKEQISLVKNIDDVKVILDFMTDCLFPKEPK